MSVNAVISICSLATIGKTLLVTNLTATTLSYNQCTWQSAAVSLFFFWTLTSKAASALVLLMFGPMFLGVHLTQGRTHRSGIRAHENITAS